MAAAWKVEHFFFDSGLFRFFKGYLKALDFGKQRRNVLAGVGDECGVVWPHRAVADVAYIWLIVAIYCDEQEAFNFLNFGGLFD